MLKLMREISSDDKIRIVAVIILIVLAAVAIYVVYLPDEKVEYTYEVKIFPPSGDNYTYSVLVPIPLDSDGNVSGMINELKIVSGICTYRTNHTENGPALEITGMGDIHLLISGTNKEYNHIIRLSMYVENNGESGYRVWHNLKGKDLHVIVSYHAISIPGGLISLGGFSIDERGDGVIKDGWRLIDGYSEAVIAD